MLKSMELDFRLGHSKTSTFLPLSLSFVLLAVYSGSLSWWKVNNTTFSTFYSRRTDVFLKGVFGFRRTCSLEFSPKSSVLVSFDHKIFSTWRLNHLGIYFFLLSGTFYQKRFRFWHGESRLRVQTRDYQTFFYIKDS